MSGQFLSLRTEELTSWLPRLVAGERLTLSGVVYAADEEAVRWLCERQEAGKSLPFARQGTILCAGIPAKNIDEVGIGLWEISAWEGFAPYLSLLLQNGLGVLVGRGRLGASTLDTLTRQKGVCLAPFSGSGRMNAKSICTASPMMGEGLREGGLFRLGVLELPLVVTVDAAGGNLYERGAARYQRKPKTLRW